MDDDDVAKIQQAGLSDGLAGWSEGQAVSGVWHRCVCGIAAYFASPNNHWYVRTVRGGSDPTNSMLLPRNVQPCCVCAAVSCVGVAVVVAVLLVLRLQGTWCTCWLPALRLTALVALKKRTCGHAVGFVLCMLLVVQSWASPLFQLLLLLRGGVDPPVMVHLGKYAQERTIGEYAWFYALPIGIARFMGTKLPSSIRSMACTCLQAACKTLNRCRALVSDL